MRAALASLVFVVTLAWAGAIVAAPRALARTTTEWRGLAVATYAIGSAICHQRPERSFHTAAIQWPVCARCSGLYLAAPLGVLGVMLGRRRAVAPRRASTATAADPVRRWRTILVIAAIPTLVSLAIEWLTGWTSGISRFVSALPLGATVAALVAAALLGLDRASATLTRSE